MTLLNNFCIMLGLFQGEHMIFILIAILLLFGGRKIPELMRGIGKGMREFKDAKDNVRNEIEMGMTDKEKDEEIIRLRREAEQARLQQQNTAASQQSNLQQP